jgi:DNA-binding HxlR family transcriptional regulator
MLIIRDLIKGKLRYNELAASLTGISSRTLSLKLKRLEEMGIVSKEDPFYLITPKGKKIDPILKAMSAYGKKYL